MAIKVFHGMKFYVPKVGDKVRVKEWDDMVKEFGVDANGSVEGVGLDPWETCVMSYGPVFTESMRGICGMEFEIKELLPHIGFNYVRAVSPNGTIGIRVSSVVLEPIDEIPES